MESPHYFSLARTKCLGPICFTNITVVINHKLYPFSCNFLNKHYYFTLCCLISFFLLKKLLGLLCKQPGLDFRCSSLVGMHGKTCLLVLVNYAVTTVSVQTKIGQLKGAVSPNKHHANLGVTFPAIRADPLHAFPSKFLFDFIGLDCLF